MPLAFAVTLVSRTVVFALFFYSYLFAPDEIHYLCYILPPLFRTLPSTTVLVSEWVSTLQSRNETSSISRETEYVQAAEVRLMSRRGCHYRRGIHFLNELFFITRKLGRPPARARAQITGVTYCSLRRAHTYIPAYTLHFPIDLLALGFFLLLLLQRLSVHLRQASRSWDGCCRRDRCLPSFANYPE